MIDFAENYPVGGPKLNIFGLGGGSSLSQLMIIPGVSRFLGGVYLPYDEFQTRHLLGGTLPDKVVSNEFLIAGLEYLSRAYRDCINVLITAAYPTLRYRRGFNHSYIGFRYRDHIDIKEIVFGKVPEHEHAKLSKDEILNFRQDCEFSVLEHTLKLIMDNMYVIKT